MRKAKLFIKGSREPIEITEEQGRKADQIKRGDGEFAGLSDKDTISIGNVWTGEKGDLRYVKFDNFIEHAEEKQYSPKELFQFEEEIKPYFIIEGDDEYNEWVEKFTKEITILDSSLFYSNSTVELLLSVRSKFKEPEANRDEIVKEVEKIVKSKIVGTLSGNGECRYLVDKHAIQMNEDDDFTVLRHTDGSVPYGELINKINKYKEWKARREYASGREMEKYAEMAGELVENKSIAHEEVGNEESL